MTPRRASSRVLTRTRAEFERAVAGVATSDQTPHAALLEATKWFVAADRDRRHDAILDVLERWPIQSLLEVGSGAGDFYVRMRSRLEGVRSYTGCDLSPRMVDLARRRHPGADFRLADILGWRADPQRPVADAAVAVGVFALLVDDPASHWLLMRRLIRRMFDLTRIGVIFDFYDFFTDGDARDPERYYEKEIGRTDDTPIYCVRPDKVRRFASRLGAVALARVRGVDGRVWRCALRRRPVAGNSRGPLTNP